jgi:hypothetical protein
MVQMMLAERAHCLNGFAVMETVAEGAPAGMPFLMHLMTELAPRFFVGALAVMAMTAVTEILCFRLGLVVFVDREIFPNADTEFAHENSCVDYGTLIIRRPVDWYIINTSSKVKHIPSAMYKPLY